MELSSTLGLQKALDDIRIGKTHPVYLISGDERGLIKEVAQKLIGALLPEGERALGLEIIGGDEEDWNKIIELLKTYPLFGTKRVILVRDTSIFLSKFNIEKAVETSKEEFEYGSLDQAVKLYRRVLGYEGFKEISEITDDLLDKLPGFSKDPRTEKWLRRVLEECQRQDLNPIPYEDNSDKLANALKEDEMGSGIPEKNVLILTTQYTDKRKRLYKAIDEIGVIIDFSIQRRKIGPAEREREQRKLLWDQAKAL